MDRINFKLLALKKNIYIYIACVIRQNTLMGLIVKL